MPLFVPNPSGVFLTGKIPQSTDVVKHLGSPDQGAELTPAVVVIKGQHAGASFALDRLPMVLGREEDCEIILDDHGVSRYHCRFIASGDDVVLEDLGSTNGTFCNYDEVTRVVLTDGDRVRLGQQTVLKFTRQDADEEAFQRQLYEAAVRDQVTGVFNKRYFMERLSSELAFALRHLTPLSLLVLDIDHFRAINETYGHTTGDRVLGQVASLLKGCSREEDVFARVGGEEFAIVARGIKPQQTFEFAERLRSVIDEYVFKDGELEFKLSVSVGTTCVVPPAGRLTVQELVRRGDDALYRAKASGRNAVYPVVQSDEGPQRRATLI